MDIRNLILKELGKKKEISASEIVKKTGFSRAYIHRFFQQLKEEGKITSVGKTHKSKYVLSDQKLVLSSMKKLQVFSAALLNTDADEHEVLDNIKSETGIFIGLKKNVSDIIDYAFTEILNNALEHSRSDTIEVKMERTKEEVRFDIVDRGVGIYNNIMDKFNLSSEMEAIGELMKGKLTTAKEAHTGEGIFFTSKAVDNMIIQSSRKKLIFNNIINDIFIREIKPFRGTKVTCFTGTKSKKNLTEIFSEYTNEDFEFSKTKVIVRLYKMGTVYISRSQARRILTGLDKFKTIILDFKDVETVGQGFADEIFRVWKISHPGIDILPVSQNENIDFMIKRAIA